MISRYLLRVFALLGTCVITLMPLSTSQAESEAEYQARIQAVDEQIKQLAAEVESARVERESLKLKVNSTEGQIEERNNRIQALDTDIKHYENKLSKLENRVEQANGQLTSDKQLLADMIQRSAQLRSNSGLQVMLQHSDPALANRLGVYYDYYFKASGNKIEATATRVGIIQKAHVEAQKSRNWLQYLQKKASGQKSSLQGQRDSVASSINQVDTNLTNLETTVEALRQDQKRLTELLEELRKNSLGASGFFVASKGKYPWPVRGKLAARFGEIKSVGKLTWNGLYIESAAGEQVQAIAAGEVVYADWLQGFGMLVIIDHGDGYMTLYGGNRELRVTKDSWVETGASIATVGDSHGHSKAGLYFEIRHNAKPVNPEHWVDAKNRFHTADK